jgi:hypothetical protein
VTVLHLKKGRIFWGETRCQQVWAINQLAIFIARAIHDAHSSGE